MIDFPLSIMSCDKIMTLSPPFNHSGWMTLVSRSAVVIWIECENWNVQWRGWQFEFKRYV